MPPVNLFDTGDRPGGFLAYQHLASLFRNLKGPRRTNREVRPTILPVAKCGQPIAAWIELRKSDFDIESGHPRRRQAKMVGDIAAALIDWPLTQRQHLAARWGNQHNEHPIPCARAASYSPSATSNFSKWRTNRELDPAP